MKLLAPIAFLATAFLSTSAFAVPNVVASIKPVHSLVAAVMAGVGEPILIVKGAASPHTYALKPSDASALESADLVFWTGHGMELFLGDALETVATKATIVELAEAPGLTLLPVREGGVFEPHADGDAAEAHHDEHDHEHGEGDMHFWLDPENAKLMVTEIAAALSRADPDNASAYAANAQTEIVSLSALEAEISATLVGAKDRPFLVFHDAYQYFEARFGLNLVGSVTVTPDVMPGAQRIDELKAKVADLGAACVFAEPNFEPAIIASITEGSQAKTGVLDPEGGALTEGPGLYADLLRGLATNLAECLK